MNTGDTYTMSADTKAILASANRTHEALFPRSVKLLDFAARFASESHEGQVRKYTNEPYITHPIAVGFLVATTMADIECVCAAYLHDVLEDTDCIVEDRFDPFISRLVVGLTDVSKPEDGNREYRKSLDRVHTWSQDSRVRSIKLADLIDNAKSITKYDPDLAHVFMSEMRETMKGMHGTNATLWKMANEVLESYYA